MNLRRIVLFVLLAAFAAQTFAQSRPRVTLGQLEEMFQNIRAKTKWNVDADLLWGYFFMDPQQDKLKPLADELSKAGYRVVNLYPSRDGQKYVLHVEKVETHTPQSLNERNIEFYRLSEKFGIASYDGMDVGPVGK
jgi:Regulator of ribonuclease activity B